MRYLSTAQGITLLLPLITHRTPARTTMLSGYPEFDYENVGNIKKPVQETAPRPSPSPPPYRSPTSLVPPSLESALRGFDFASSSDDEVAAIAARLMEQLKREAAPLSESPLTAALADRVLLHDSLPGALANVLASKMVRKDHTSKGTEVSRAEAAALCKTMKSVYASPPVLRAVVADLIKCFLVDPAADGLLQPMLFFKGFHALQVYRVAHMLWGRGGTADQAAALMLQSRVSEAFSIDIHPGATIGNGVMLDHATGVVIGSTAILGDDIYMLHQVTLGATGKPTFGAKRHPTVGSRCVLGASSTVLGDVTVGDGCTVGASAIVTRDVPDDTTVVGVNKLVQKKDPESDEYTWYYDI
jgi:serine O-acetyltransferase